MCVCVCSWARGGSCRVPAQSLLHGHSPVTAAYLLDGLESRASLQECSARPTDAEREPAVAARPALAAALRKAKLAPLCRTV